jgi:hypothetical protein
MLYLPFGMSEFYGASDEAENLKVLQHSIDTGCILWDTAYKPYLF